MVFQSFSSKIYCYGIKVSTKYRFILSFIFANKAFRPNDFKTEKVMSAAFSGFGIYAQAMIYYVIA